LCVVLFWRVAVREPPEPAYKGRLLREWVGEVAVNESVRSPPPEAVEALRGIGPKAFPRLIAWLGPTKPPSGLSDTLRELLPFRTGLSRSESWPDPYAA